MSKELDALESIVVDLSPFEEEHNKENIILVETALKELEEYKSILKDFGLENPQNLIDNLNIIKDCKFHKKLQALEIIKKILVVAELPNLLKTLYDYGKLTEQECNLLKEVLK